MPKPSHAVADLGEGPGGHVPLLFLDQTETRRARTSFALSRSALVCLRGSRKRRVPCDIKFVDIDFEVVEGAIQLDY